MATEYISREAAEKRLNRLERESYHSSVVWPDHVEQCREALREIDPADVVSRDCYDRVLTESDTMREMLAQIGKKPGDKMDDVRPVSRGKWKHDGSDWKNRFICDQCGYKWFFEAEEAHFCPNCGCAMENEKLRQAYGYDVLR